jgi:hypothetical protein
MDSQNSMTVSRPSFEQKQQFFAQALLAIIPGIIAIEGTLNPNYVVTRSAMLAKLLTSEWSRHYQIFQNDTPAS